MLLPALPDPGARHVRLLSPPHQVRRPASLQLAEELYDRDRVAVSVCGRSVQPLGEITRMCSVLDFLCAVLAVVMVELGQIS